MRNRVDRCFGSPEPYSDRLSFVPIFGRGEALLTPVFVEDIGRLFVQIMAEPELAAVDFVSQAGAVTDAERRLLAERFPEFRATAVWEGLRSYLGPKRRR